MINTLRAIFRGGRNKPPVYSPGDWEHVNIVGFIYDPHYGVRALFVPDSGGRIDEEYLDQFIIEPMEKYDTKRTSS